ncbi:MAG: TlpA disulfide reductase family protein [Pirellulales bacterium]
MLSSLTWLALLTSAPADDAALAAGTQLVFQGSVAQVQADRSLAEPAKSFDLTMLAAPGDEPGSRLFWLVEERGQGAWPWAERFGLVTLDEQANPVGHPGPSLLYDYGDGKSIVALPPPLLIAGRPLAEGAAWESEGLRYEVAQRETIGERAVWPIQVHNRFGHQRTLWVDDRSLVVQLEERVFMNQGTEHRLQWRLLGSERLSDEQLAAALAGFEAMTGLRARLNRPARTESDAWTSEERGVLAEHLPQVEKLAGSGPLAKLVRAAVRDLELQSGRADAVGQLRDKYQGSQVPRFTAGSGRDRLADSDLAGQATLLHFWDYRHEPLEEPYGQVGYLEYLYARHKAAGLKIYGIAVDGRLNDEATRPAAVAGVRKLKSFMNLSYPIVFDGGELLKQFGDPRIVGAALPLFVLIAPDGKIVHYHVGYYDVDQQQGLKELDALVGELLKKKSP